MRHFQRVRCCFGNTTKPKRRPARCQGKKSNHQCYAPECNSLSKRPGAIKASFEDLAASSFGRVFTVVYIRAFRSEAEDTHCYSHEDLKVT